jgi:hypothetical protein
MLFDDVTHWQNSTQAMGHNLIIRIAMPLLAIPFMASVKNFLFERVYIWFACFNVKLCMFVFT